MKNLTPQEINELLNPTPVATCIVYLNDGTSRQLQSPSPPSLLVGGYIGKAGTPRKYVAGDPSIVAYKIVKQ